jgi:hypothetical protein
MTFVLFKLMTPLSRRGARVEVHRAPQRQLCRVGSRKIEQNGSQGNIESAGRLSRHGKPGDAHRP